MKRSPSEKGTTLPELLAATLIFSILMALVAMILRGGQEQASVTEARMHLEESLRQSLYQMGLEVREAAPSRTNIGNGGASLTFQIPSSVDNGGNITQWNTLTYRVGGNGRQLVRIDSGTGQSTILANDIQSVNFASTGNPIGTVQYAVTAQKTLWNQRNITVASTGEARLRNV